MVPGKVVKTVAVLTAICLGCGCRRNLPSGTPAVGEARPQNVKESVVMKQETVAPQPAYDMPVISDTVVPVEPVAGSTLLPAQPSGFGPPISDRAAWQRLAVVAEFARVIGSAEELLKSPIDEVPDDLYLDFSRTGIRKNWERAESKRRGRLRPLVLAECLEDKGRFLAAIAEIVTVVCAEKTWVLPAHDRSLDDFYGRQVTIDLWSSAMAWELALVHHILGDRLTPELRRVIEANVHRRVLAPYRDMVEGRAKPMWWMTTTNNWNAVCLAGVTGAALALLESPEKRAFYVEAAQKYSRSFLSGFTADGYCTEGLGYWGYGFGHYVLLSEVIYQSTGGAIDMLARPDARKPALFPFGIEIVNRIYPAFADCSPSCAPPGRYMYFISRRFGLGAQAWEKQFETGWSGSLFESLMFAFPNSATRTAPASADTSGVGIRTWFDKGGVLICRPLGGTSDPFAVALKGGNNAEHHNHNDLGSYVVVVNDDQVLRDPGGEEYTARTFSPKRYDSNVLNSLGHPVPVVAGKLQKSGAAAAAKVVSTDFSDAQDTLVLDIASAYDVPELASLTRTFVYVRTPTPMLTVTDTVKFTTPQTFGTALVTFGTCDRKDWPLLAILGQTEGARVSCEAVGGEIAATEKQIEDGHRPLRIGLDFKAPVTEAAITVRIEPLTGLGTDSDNMLRNGGFEYGRFGWQLADNGISEISTARAATGSTSLHIIDPGKDAGSSVTSGRMPVRDGCRDYLLSGRVFLVSGKGLDIGLYIQGSDAGGKALNPEGKEIIMRPESAEIGQWREFACPFTVTEGTREFRFWIHSFNAAQVEAFLDDFRIAPRSP
ncbi:MAG: hypothetical protein A3K19_12225 [Lentisphaerae bacterium RIFOXYB12_FULL_65_16]|nr:MAG: hypothetical protein A3K18_28090 [Lentisphaerae bacterium RIFOXYA12_64_32]OGV86173.1 MAG: hypothetical protein A3K19_12225 [Lentisphaerae bacterium RIFOXYB12_FULL_65_16]